MICTPILAQTKVAALSAMHAAAAFADILEVRLDYILDFDPKRPTLFLQKLLAGRQRPVILTFRPKEQGGARAASLQQRLGFWIRAIKSDADYFDIEYDIFPSLVEALGRESAPLEKIILSRHDFDVTPENLPEWFERSFPVLKCLVKVAALARNSSDVLRLFQLLKRIESEGKRQAIVIGMGEGGALTRILGPAYGAKWTYSSAVDGSPSSPGQFSARELRDVFAIHRISRETAVVGLIGKPVGHSISKHIHNAAFRNARLDWTYIPVEIQSGNDDLHAFVRDFLHPKTRSVSWDARGYSVTIPYKVEILKCIDLLTPNAEKIGAVNTLIVEKGQLIGENTDVHGAMAPLEKLMNIKGLCVAVFGSGGAARAVVCGLAERGARVTIFARNVGTAKRLGHEFGVAFAAIEDFDGRNFDGLVNATPVGMQGFQSASALSHENNSAVAVSEAEASPVAFTRLAGLQWVYDLIYKPRATKLLRDAQAHGIQTLDGLEMLVEQAARQFELWTGCAPPLDIMRQAAENALAPPISQSL